MSQNFDLFFYYKKREKIRSNFLLTYLLPKLKFTILNNYKSDNYKDIDLYLLGIRTLLTSLIYFIIIKATYASVETVQFFTYFFLFILMFFGTLALIGKISSGLQVLEKNHYYRMIGDRRNELLREELTSRINLVVIRVIFPFTFFLYIYLSIKVNYLIIFQYLFGIAIFYYSLRIFLFLMQYFYFVVLKKVEFLKGMFAAFSTFFIIGFSFFCVYVPSFLEYSINNSYLFLLVYILIELVIIFLLIKISKKAYKRSYSYSVTHVLIQKKEIKVKRNFIERPSKLIKFFIRKNTIVNSIFKKDHLQMRRRDKKEFYGMVFFVYIGLYQIFTILALIEEDGILTSIFIDVSILTITLILYYLNFAKLKNAVFYSSEWENLKTYHTLGYDKYSIYKAKEKMCYLLSFLPILTVIIVPMLPMFLYGTSEIIWVFIRIPYIILTVLLIIDYHLLQDVRYVRTSTIDPIRGMGVWNVLTLLFFINGVMNGFVVNLFMKENSIFLGNEYLLIVYYCILLLILLGFKIVNIRRVNQLKGVDIYD